MIWTPKPTDTPAQLKHKQFVMMIIAMMTLVLCQLGLQIWQNLETSPRVYCSLAKIASPDMTTGCVTVLVALIGVKDHSLLASNVIIGLVVLSLAVVLLGVRIRGSGPGGMSVDVGADKTTVLDAQGNKAEIPTPPTDGSN